MAPLAPSPKRFPTLHEILNKRIVLMAGKGGVGRTTLTAAVAVAAQRRGKRVLIAEIGDESGDYSPLARCFGRERLPSKPEGLAPGIEGVTLVARTGQELFLAQVLRTAALARATLASDAIRKFLAAGPSFREMGVFFHLLSCLRATAPDGSPRHEVLVIDMPATGHTLALTGLPESLLRLVTRGPIASALREGQSYMNDPKHASAYVVTLPETLPVSECLELLEGLNRTSMPVGGVLVNRLPDDPFSPEEREALLPLVEGKAVLGAEGFGRAGLCRRELSRLRHGTALPLLAVPEFLSTGSALVEHLAAALDLQFSPGGLRPAEQQGVAGP